MAGDGRDLIRLLKDELRFVELGGYESSKRGDWHPRLIFRDSLTCLNSGLETRRHACSDCHLFYFVGFEHRSKEVPCHFISLTETGETIADLEAANRVSHLISELKGWLRWKIRQLEMESL